jgi:hypothetical protein
MALLPAMRMDRRIFFSGGRISPSRAKNIAAAQDLYASWFPELSRVPVHAKLGATSANPKELTACLYTGGVDSTYSLLSTRPDGIVYVVDTHNEPGGITRLMQPLIARVGEAYDASPVVISSNVRLWVDPYADWGAQFYGLFFSAIAAFISGEYSTVVIPDGEIPGVSDQHGWGTHPRLNPFLGGDSNETVFHGGAVARLEKIRAISGDRFALSQLRVCWRSTDQLNCSRCPKCLRTMVAIDILGLSKLCTSFLWPLQHLPYSNLGLEAPNELARALEHQRAARDIGRHDLADFLERAIAASKVRP